MTIEKAVLQWLIKAACAIYDIYETWKIEGLVKLHLHYNDSHTNARGNVLTVNSRSMTTDIIVQYLS